MSVLQEFLTVSLALVLAGLAWAFLRAGKVESPARRSRRGIEINGVLRKLLQHIQMHRGMASIILNGDGSFNAKLKAKQGDINDELRVMADKTPAARDLFVGAPLERIQSDWEMLRVQALQLTVSESFERHSALIQQVLHLIADVAERSQLDVGGPVPHALSDMLWRRLPELAEDLGKARAIGSGVAAAGQVSGVDRIRLNFLVNRIRSGLKAMQAAISEDTGNRFGGEAHQSASRVQTSVDRLLQMIESELIAAERPNLSAATYFSAATDALEVVYRLYDSASAGLARPKGHREIVSAFGAVRTA
jgi:hypothetical protein